MNNENHKMITTSIKIKLTPTTTLSIPSNIFQQFFIRFLRFKSSQLLTQIHLMEQNAINIIFPGIEMHSNLPHSLPAPKNCQSMVMFQEVVSKSFQIIKTILPRVNSLFQLNQELQRSVSNIERKLTRLQYDNQNLHYQMRTNHLTNENRYNAIVNDFCNINNEACVLKKHAEILAKSVKEVKNIQKDQEDAETPDSKFRRFQERTRKIIFQDQLKPKEEMERVKLRRKNSIDLKDEDIQQNGKVRFNLNSNISIQCSDKNINASQRQGLHSQNQLNRKSNLKIKKGNKNAFSTKKIKNQNGKFQEFLREIENYHFHNQMVKKNYEKLMDDYCNQNDLQFEQINSKINHLSRRLDQIDPHNNLQQLLTKCSQLEFAFNLDQFSNQSIILETQISNKVNSLQFNHVVKDLNARLTKVHEMIQKFANREQTQKAIMFLQHKINNIYQGDDVINQPRKSLHHAELQKGSLRIVPVPVSQQKNEKSKLAQDINVQTLDNTPRTFRLEQQPLVVKRNITSLHASLSRGNLTETRKGVERMSLCVVKSQNVDEETKTNRKSKYRELHLLKQKSIEILEKGKGKQKLKKERLIFQYD